MLYDPDTSLSRDTRTSCDNEQLLREELKSLNNSKPNARLSQKQRFIHFLNEQHIRLPHLVVRFGSQLIKNAAGRLGNAVWDLYERVFIASLDSHDFNVSSWCLNTLEQQFPVSLRVDRLKGMNSEARGHFATADEFYTELLQDEPTNIPLLRRQIACAKGAGDRVRAISLLNKYLKTFSSDESAWVELSDLYIQTQQYDLASFCFEELIMITPENYLYNLKYAELQYTRGHMDIARQYYAQSLELKPVNNLRALYGLILTLKTKQGSSTAPNAAELYSWSVEQLLAHYKKYQPTLLDIAKQTCTDEALAIASTSSTNQQSSTTTPAAANVTVPAASTLVDSAPSTPAESDLPD